MDYEFNKRIAVDVMGYCWVTDKYDRTSKLVRKEIRHSEWLGDYEYNELLLGGLPDYSGDITGAWQVVKELNTRGIFLAELKQAPRISAAGTQWFAVFTNLQLQPEGISGWVDTAPLAICHAALDICEKLKLQGQEKP